MRRAVKHGVQAPWATTGQPQEPRRQEKSAALLNWGYNRMQTRQASSSAPICVHALTQPHPPLGTNLKVVGSRVDRGRHPVGQHQEPAEHIKNRVANGGLDGGRLVNVGKPRQVHGQGGPIHKRQLRGRHQRQHRHKRAHHKLDGARQLDVLHAQRQGAEQLGHHVDRHGRVAVIVDVSLEARARRARADHVEALNAQRSGAQGDLVKCNRAEPGGHLRIDERLHVGFEGVLDKSADKRPQLRDDLVHPLGALNRTVIARIGADRRQHLRG